jgi:hypothetical protein
MAGDVCTWQGSNGSRRGGGTMAVAGPLDFFISGGFWLSVENTHGKKLSSDLI